MSELIVTVHETNGCSRHCQGKLSTQPESVWIFQVWTFLSRFNNARDLLPIMLCFKCRALCLTCAVCLLLNASLCSSSPLLLSFPSVFVLAENCAGLFEHILPLSYWKPVSNGEDYVVKCVSFWYKAPKPHTSDKKIVSSAPPRLISPPSQHPFH